MLEEKHEQTGIYLAELIRAALHGLKAPEKPEGVSWEMLYGFAKRMSVEAISYMGVATLIQKPEKEVLTKWENAAHATLIRNLQYDIEREQILAEMEKAGLSYLTMKGIKLATYYPKPGMRSMCDNDILVGFVEKYEDGYRAVEGSKEQIGEVLEKIMLERGYEITHASVYQDAYKKEPMYNFEMHKSLLYNFSEHYFYYLNPWKKVVPVEGSEYEYKFTLEDEYIYSLVHGHKHYSAGGCGIRLLIDEYIYLSKGSEMNWNYIYQELEVLGLTAYEKEISEAAKNIFSKERGMLKAEEKEMILSMMYNGTYGRISTHRKRDIEKFRNEKGEMTILSKLNYAKNRLILPDEWYENYYTFCKKYPWLKPWVGIYRTITGFLRHPRQLMEELRILLKTK